MGISELNRVSIFDAGHLQIPQGGGCPRGDPSLTTLEQWERFCGGMLELGKRIGAST